MTRTLHQRYDERHVMTREQYEELVSEARRRRFSFPERWAWNQAVQRGWHPELSDIPEPRPPAGVPH